MRDHSDTEIEHFCAFKILNGDRYRKRMQTGSPTSPKVKEALTKRVRTGTITFE